jgi:hypothetical protein
MPFLFIFLLLLPISVFAQLTGGNSIGGQYASQAMAAVARVDDETAPFLNPAGLAKITRNSISSGASAYSFFTVKNGQRADFTTNNTTTHAAIIEQIKNFNFGFIVYTVANSQDQKSSDNSGLNSQSYFRLSSTSESESLNANIFSFALAPRNASWGIALNIQDVNFKQTNNSIEHNFSASANGRKWENLSSETSVVQQSINLSYGHQYAYKNHHFGVIIRSAGYFLSNTLSFKQDYLSVQGSAGSDVVINQYNLNDTFEDQRSKATPENIQLGYAYTKDAWDYEINIMIEGAGEEIEIDDSLYELRSNSYNTGTDDYNVNDLDTDSSGSPGYTRKRIVPSIGVQYKATEKDIWGVGARYLQTNDINSEGTNDLSLSFGYTNYFKNFKGTYTLQYDRAFDTGHNERYDDVSEENIKIDLTSERISLIIAGSYFF